MATWTTFQEAGSSLLERRRSQRGFPTLGDDADHALVHALAALPEDGRHLARETGARLGADVYSRRYHDDALAKGIEVLSQALASSGFGALSVEGAFLRSARVRFSPSAVLSIGVPAVRSAFLEGLLEGYLSQALKCDAMARADPDDPDAGIDLHLGAGRDVNQRWGRSRA